MHNSYREVVIVDESLNPQTPSNTTKKMYENEKDYYIRLLYK